jgi:adenylosuccinate lyase
VLTENLTGLCAAGAHGMCVPAHRERRALARARHQPFLGRARCIGPDATVTLDFALARLTGVIDKLVVYPEADGAAT